MAFRLVNSLRSGAAPSRAACLQQGRRRGRSLAPKLSFAALAIAGLTGAVAPADRSPARLPTADQPPPSATTPPPARASVVPGAPTNSAAERLQLAHEDGVLVIQAHRASRLDVAQRLAALTGSALLEQPQALASARPLTAQWRGRDIAAAWALVLGNEASHALQCDENRCRVWITPQAAAAPASNADKAAAPAAIRSALPATRVATPMPAATLAATGTLEPDPPGLFPAD